MRDNRRRIGIAVASALVIAVGLASRSDAVPMPGLVKTYAGDTLWAVMVFLALAFLRPRMSVVALAGIALAISFGVELLQLVQAPWLRALRETLPGKLLLGRGFRFSDLVCYTLGISAAALAFQWATERSLRQFWNDRLRSDLHRDGRGSGCCELW